MEAQSPCDDGMGSAEPEPSCLKRGGKRSPEVAVKHSLDLRPYGLVLDSEPMIVQDLGNFPVGSELAGENNTLRFTSETVKLDDVLKLTRFPKARVPIGSNHTYVPRWD